MTVQRTFQCLRCEHRFPVDYDAKQVVERACPRCGSNSVRPETPPKAAGAAEKGTGG
jgi:predicted  nucleic acid-binding Zn-ribbon protein